MGDQLQDAKPFGLTERQIEVLEAVARAGGTREAAAALSLSEATVKRHLANIYERMGVVSRLEAVAAGVRAGLLSPSELWETSGEDGLVELLRRKAGYGREEFVRQLLANFPNGSVNVFDRDLRYLLAEGRGLEEEGLSPEALVGKTIDELFPKESADEVGPYYRRAFSGENVEFELPLGERTYVIYAAPLREEDGEVRTIIAVAQDVTERKRLQAQRERLLVRERGIRAAEEERKRISRELHDRVAHTMAIVHQSLQLYQAYRERAPEAAEQKLELAKRKAAEAMEDTRNLSEVLRASEGEGLGLEEALSELLSESVPRGMTHALSVAGDEGAVPDEVREQLFLVLREAVRNAVSHSGASKVSITVRTDRQRIVGVVEDDGRGFERKSRERSEPGGLAYMAERASLMGGTCSIESAPGEGTRVQTSFPLNGT
jgi:PAS domain S-box-containing protein